MRTWSQQAKTGRVGGAWLRPFAVDFGASEVQDCCPVWQVKLTGHKVNLTTTGKL